jgi:hypothetical protein
MKIGGVRVMHKYPGSDVIVTYITKHGPKMINELCEALHLQQPTVILYLKQPVIDGVLVFDKIAKGAWGPVRRYRLPTQPKCDSVQAGKQQRVIRGKAEVESPPKIGRFDPADPFGLVARMARGEKVELPKSARVLKVGYTGSGGEEQVAKG